MRMAAVTIAVLASVPFGEARAQYAPWCAFYSDAMSGENCGFVSLEHCRAEVRGIGGVCYPNPWYAAQRPRPRSAATKRRR
jgi:Protein of unknown function (DUF3551)